MKQEGGVFELAPRASGRGTVSALPLFKRLVSGDDARGGGSRYGSSLLAQRPQRCTTTQSATFSQASHLARRAGERSRKKEKERKTQQCPVDAKSSRNNKNKKE